MRPQSLVEFLKRARIPYTTFHHRVAFTAQEEAAASHVADLAHPTVGVFAHARRK